MIESWIDEDMEYLDSMIRDEIDQCIKSINIIDGIVGGEDSDRYERIQLKWE